MTDNDHVAHTPVHVVVTCSNRKSQTVPDQLRMSDLRGLPSSRRFATWTQRLSTHVGADHPATALYAGEHWQVARTLPDHVAPRPATLWVCSAGYGLIAANTTIRAYAATFATGGRDSVGEDKAAAREWWTRLTQWPGPVSGQPRSFVDLARRDPHATIIAVLSEAYQRACAADILAASRLLSDREQMSVIGPITTELADVTVPVTARLQPLLGGSLLSLNARVAALLLRGAAEGDHDLSRRRLRDLVEQSTITAPTRDARAAGRRMTDEEVLAFICAHADEQGVSATGLLRRLRQSGQSCEQARFGHLFTEVTAWKVNR